jgi:hypothetical protein
MQAPPLTEAVYLVNIFLRDARKILVKVLRNGSHPISHPTPTDWVAVREIKPSDDK